MYLTNKKVHITFVPCLTNHKAYYIRTCPITEQITFVFDWSHNHRAHYYCVWLNTELNSYLSVCCTGDLISLADIFLVGNSSSSDNGIWTRHQIVKKIIKKNLGYIICINWSHFHFLFKFPKLKILETSKICSHIKWSEIICVYS